MQTNLVKIKKKQQLEELPEETIRSRKLNKLDHKRMLRDKRMRNDFYNPRSEV